MSTRILTRLLLLTFATVTLFGLTFTASSPAHHDSHCPLMGSEMSLCATALDHIEHWQIAFAAALPVIVVFTALLLVTVLLYFPFLPRGNRVRLKWKSEIRLENHPTLYQELFAQGLLNPRIP
ncbi:MAG: hypothetical protein AAB472_00620 [Patescibacteria group bacterium]